MNRDTRKKLKKSVQRTFTLLLATLMLSSGAYADNSDEKVLRELYGNDWRAVSALQPGDNYISGDTLYVCHEAIYVDWKRVRSAGDLDPTNWGSKERVLLMTDLSGEKLFVGNDYANIYAKVDGTDEQIVLVGDSPSDTRRVISGVTKDTSGKDHVEYEDEFVYPELNEFFQNSTGGYPYPDTFRTMGTMNAPYIRYNGTDTDNGNNRKFKIILSKDDGSASSIGLSHDEDCKRIDLKAVNQCNGFTFHMKNGKLRIFENIKDEDDVLLSVIGGKLYGKEYEKLGDMPTDDLVIYVGEKSIGKRIEVISLALEDAEQNPDALENVYGGAVEFYRWQKVESYNQLPTGKDTYRALLIWNSRYYLKGDDFRRHSDSNSMAFYVNEEKGSSAAPGNLTDCPEIDLEQKEFYTFGGLGTPYLKFSYKDSNPNNDYCPYYTFQLAGADDMPSGKWLCDGDNELDVCVGNAGKSFNGGMDVGIVVGKGGANDGNDCERWDAVKLFFNEADGLDTGLDYSGNMLFGEANGWDCGEFVLYIGVPVVYPAVRQNYVVGEDQFMHISQNGAMLKNVTITVAKGGVLSVESWFMNNGRIVVDGGTLIVQDASNPLGDEMADDTEDSVMMPFADIHPTVSGSLELKNGGELVVMDNARAAFSSIKATTGSSVLNCGLLLAENIDLHSSTLENRENATILAGYDFREMNIFRNSSISKIKENLTSRLQTDVGCFTRRLYSNVHNDGEIIFSTVRMSVHNNDSVKQSGSGSYAHVRGSESRNMLKK